MPDQAGGFILTLHAQTEIERRGIDDNTIWRVREDPEQRETVRPAERYFSPALTSVAEKSCVHFRGCG